MSHLNPANINLEDPSAEVAVKIVAGLKSPGKERKGCYILRSAGNTMLMRLIPLIALLLFSSAALFSQVYNIGTNNGQTITTCNGIFYDSGGQAGDYGNNENYTVTFCSGNGNAVKFTFSSFNVRTGDTLYVYDGPDISSPLKGKYSNAVVPVSLNSAGTCLTFNFRSNNVFTRPGWVADITCCPPPVTSPIVPSNPYECAGSTVNYSVDLHAGATYNWTVTNGTPASVIGGTNNLNVTWDPAGDITGYVKVVEINSCGSKDSSQVIVDIYSLPVVDFSGLNTYYCSYSAPATLTGSPSGGIFTGPGISGNIFTPSVAGSGTHSITYTYTDPITGCTNQMVRQTTVTVPLTFITGASATSYCAGSGVTITLSGSESGVSYQLLRDGINDGPPLPGTGSPLAWTNRQNGVYTITASYNLTICTAVMSGSQTITQNALPVPTFTAQPGATTCSLNSVTYTTQTGQTNYIWGFTGVAGTDYNIISGGTVTDNTVTLVWLTAGSKTVTINYTNASGCTAAAPVASSPTTVTLTPAAPAGSASQNFCSEVSPTVANLSATGTGILWYAAATGGAPLLTTLPLTNNTHYYASQTVSGCESISRLDVTALIFSIPLPPVSSPGTGATCSQITANWTASAGAASYRLDVSTVNTFATYLAGYQDRNVGNVTSYNITGLSAGNTYYYRIRAVDFCGTSGNSSVISYSTLPAAPAQPGAIAGLATQCPSAAGQTYSISSVLNATTYTWSVPAGWSITAGQGTISITVTSGLAGQNGNISVTAGNNCGVSIPRSLAVTVNPNASITSVTGTSPLCLGGTATYTANGVVTGGGTGAWSSSNPAVATVSAAGLVTGVTAGTCNIIYTITGGCGGTVSAQQSITVSPNASITSVTGTSPLCIGGTASYTTSGVVLSGGTGAWSSSNPAVATVSAAGLVTAITAGTCNIIFTITGGCGGTVSAQQLVTINPNAAIASVTGTSPLCIGGTSTYTANGVLTGGGTGAWSSSNPAVATVSAAGLVTAVAAGACNIIYTVTGGCGGTVSAQQPVTVSPNASITSVNGTSPLCIGGTATYTTSGVVLSGGTGAWSSSNPAVATVSAAGLVTGLTAGTCNIIYTITGGCGGTVSAQRPVTINPNAAIASVTGTSPLCIGGTATYTTNGLVTGGGTGVWSSSNPAIATVNAAGLVTGVSAGTCNIIYTITGGCGGTVSAQRSLTINPNAGIASVNGTSPICIGTTIMYTTSGIVLSGGTGAWSSSNPAVATVNPAGIVRGISAGTCNIIYTITGGCGGTVSALRAVTVNANAAVTSVTGTSPLCIAGTASFTANGVVTGGGTGAWSSSNPAIASVSAAGLVTGVSAGTCNIIYTITGGCGGTVSAQTPVTINPNASIASVSGVSPLCIGGTTTFTTAGVVLGGGTGAWSSSNPAIATVNAAGLVTAVSAGTCNIIYTITGGCGGIATAQRALTVNPNAAIASVTGTSPLCTGGTANYTANGVVAGGGTGAWSSSNPAIATVSATGLVTGVAVGTCNIVYTITGGCGGTVSALQPVTINPGASIASVTGASPLCAGTTTAYTANGVFLSGGTGAWSSSNPAVATVTAGGLVTAVSAGTCNIIYTITGGCGATVSAQQPVTVNMSPVLLITQPSPACAPATVDLTAASVTAGSTPGLTLTYWTDASGTISYGTPSAAAAGTYYIKGTTAAGCFDIKPVTAVINPVPVIAGTPTNISCAGGSTGAIDITVTTGTSPYTYTWTGTGVVASAEDQTGLTAGVYSVVVTDANGCSSLSVQYTLNQPPVLTGAVTSQTNVTVYGGNDGSVTVNGAGGTPPFLYMITGGSFQASGTFGSLTAGNYTVTVQDNNLCTFDIPVIITQPVPPISVSVTSQTNVLCFGSTTGSVTVDASGGVLPYEFSLDGGSYQSSGTFTALAAGDHTVTVRDAAMSTVDVSFTISEPASALSGTIVATDIKCFGDHTGSADLTVSGGTPPYSFAWDNGAVSEDLASVAAGDYNVVVTDGNGCTFMGTITVSQPSSALSGTIVSQTDITCSGAANGSVDLTAAGGVSPYEYSIDGGAFQAAGSFTGLGPGVSAVTIRDANLCTITVQVTISEPSPLVAELTKEDASCPGESDGKITLAISGGSAPYTVIWEDGPTDVNRTDIPAGTYSVVVTDKNGCAVSAETEVGSSVTAGCLEIPTIITPNNDGYNDTWIIKNIELFPNAEVSVYNRWGELVFQTKNLSAHPWDGTSDGKQLPTDSYHYVLHLNDGSKARSGVISIIR